jgi:hypothetical protein
MSVSIVDVFHYAPRFKQDDDIVSKEPDRINLKLAFQRRPEALQFQPRGSVVVHQDDMHLGLFARLAKCRGTTASIFV